MARAFEGKKSWKPSDQDEGTHCPEKELQFHLQPQSKHKRAACAPTTIASHKHSSDPKVWLWTHRYSEKPKSKPPNSKTLSMQQKKHKRPPRPAKKSKEKRWNQTYRFRLADDVGNCFAGLFENARCYNPIKGYIGLHIETRHSFFFLPPAPQTVFTLHLRNLCTQEWVWN